MLAVMLQLLEEGEAVTAEEEGPKSEGTIGRLRELDQNCSPGGALE